MKLNVDHNSDCQFVLSCLSGSEISNPASPGQNGMVLDRPTSNFANH